MEDNEQSVLEQIGQLAANLMDFAESRELAELSIGGIVLAGKTSNGTSTVITRTTARDPFACTEMWAAAINLEVKMAREDVQRAIGERNEKIEYLERQLRNYGWDEDE